jgi:hypothetical protein
MHHLAYKPIVIVILLVIGFCLINGRAYCCQDEDGCCGNSHNPVTSASVINACACQLLGIEMQTSLLFEATLSESIPFTPYKNKPIIAEWYSRIFIPPKAQA